MPPLSPSAERDARRAAAACFPRMLDTSGTFLRSPEAMSPPRPGPERPADFMPITISGWPGRIDVWTPEEFERIAPACRPIGARRVRHVWVCCSVD